MRPHRLGDSLELLIDHRGKTPLKLGADFTDFGVPVASALMVKDGRLDLSGCRYISTETAAKWMSIPMRAGDVLLTSEAPLGRVARVPNDDPLVLGQRLFGLRGRAGVIHSQFLYYALQTSNVQSQLLGRATGTTVVGIRQSALRDITIDAPDWVEQLAIAAVLGALDDKIVVNRAVALTADSLATAYSAMSPSVCRLADIADLDRRTVTPSSMDLDSVAHYSIPAFDNGQQPSMDTPSEIKSNKFLIDSPRVLISKLNPRFPRVWAADNITGLPGLASTELLPLAPSQVSYRVLRALLGSPDFGKQLESQVAGTSGSHQRVRPEDLMRTEIPDPRVLSADVVELIDSLGALAVQTRRENLTLSELRDTLLPALMSGRLRVKDAEKRVGGAV